MLSSHEETQSEISRVSMSDAQNFKKVANAKSHFASEALSDIQNQPNYLQSSMKIVQRNANQNANQTIKNKDNKPIMLNQNVILIKPKRSSGYGMPQKNDQNAVSLIKNSTKSKKTTKLKEEKNSLNETTSLHFKTMKNLLSQRNFILKPLQNNDTVKCKITRFSGVFNNSIFISLKGQSKLLLTCQKLFTFIGNTILLKTPEENSSQDQTNKLSQKPMEPLIGMIQSNFDGSIFNVYEFNDLTKQKDLIATIQYQGNKGISEGPRRVKIFYKDQTIPTMITNMETGQNFRDFVNRTGNNQSIQLFETRQPQYNSQNEIYYLSFNPNVNIVPSVHNTIFVDKQQKPVLKFFKTFSKQYELNCYHPLSPFIGCAYVISSFCFKLISQ